MSDRLGWIAVLRLDPSGWRGLCRVSDAGPPQCISALWGRRPKASREAAVRCTAEYQPASQRSSPCQEERCASTKAKSTAQLYYLFLPIFASKIVTDGSGKQMLLTPFTVIVVHFRMGSTSLSKNRLSIIENERGSKYGDASKSTHRLPEVAPQSHEDGCHRSFRAVG